MFASLRLRIDKKSDANFNHCFSDVCTSAEYKELQTKYSRQSDDLDIHLRTLSDVEKEKMDLVEGKSSLKHPMLC